MNTQQSVQYASVTPDENGEGAHARRKLLLSGLAQLGYDVLWIGPSKGDIENLEGIKYQPTGAPLWLKKIPMIGTLLTILIAVYKNRTHLHKIDQFIAFSEFEILAAQLMLPETRIAFIQRNDIVEKSRIVSNLTPSPVRKVRARMRSRLVTWLQQRTLPNVDKIIVQTPPHASRLKARHAKLPRVIVVTNDAPTDRSPVYTKGTCTPTRNKPVIGFLGRVEWEVKGIELLLKSFKVARDQIDVKLWIAGDGGDLAVAKKAVDEMGLTEDVSFLGKVANPFKFLGDLNVMLATAPYDDCPNVLLEAMIAKVPIVATGIAAHQFLLHGSPGLSSTNDENSIGQTIIRCLGDNEFRNKILKVQQDRITDFSFDWPAAMANALSSTGEDSHETNTKQCGTV